MAKKTQTQEWIALGYRHDDVNLWEELCIFLDKRIGKEAYQSSMPPHLYYLTLSSNDNTYKDWLYNNMLMPVFYQTGHGWRLKKDWRDRITIMRDPSPQRLIDWLARLQDSWYETKMLRPQGDDRFHCLMCQREYVAPFPLFFFGDDALKRVKHLDGCGMTKIQARITQLQTDHPGLILPSFPQDRMQKAIENMAPH